MNVANYEGKPEDVLEDVMIPDDEHLLLEVGGKFQKLTALIVIRLMIRVEMNSFSKLWGRTLCKEKTYNTHFRNKQNMLDEML